MGFRFNGKLWLYNGEGAWVFVTLPRKVSEEIKLITSSFPRKGFGSVKVSCRVNGIEWKTSIFPDKKLGAYILPIKKDVRQKANVSINETYEFEIQLADIA